MSSPVTFIKKIMSIMYIMAILVPKKGIINSVNVL